MSDLHRARSQLVLYEETLDRINAILWEEDGEQCPDKEWDAETIEHIAEVMRDCQQSLKHR